MKKILLLLLLGCNSGNNNNTSPDMSTMRPPLGAPLQPTMNNWTWVDFPNSACNDGTPTGIGINQGSSDNLIVFLNGGGACWDYLTCFQIGTAALGPFGKTEFDGNVGNVATGTIFDRNDAGNPFKDWSYVFVPYCTGDVHAGDNVVMYSDNNGMDTHTFHHAGHKNILEFVPRIAGTWPAPDKLVVSGSSAGGYGASFNYDTFRQYWPTGQVYLLDDSGPALEGDAVPSGYKTAWYTQWRLDKVLDPVCGEPCKTDLSQAVTLLVQRYPKDRMALLSSLQDQTIRGYFLLSPSGFQGELLLMAEDILDPTTNYRYFFVPGQTHTMLGDLHAFTSQGTPLTTWLTQFITDDASWTSLKP